MDTSVTSKDPPMKRKNDDREESSREETLWDHARSKTFLTGTGWGDTFWLKPDHTIRMNSADRVLLSLNQQFFSRMTQTLRQDENGYIRFSSE